MTQDELLCQSYKDQVVLVSSGSFRLFSLEETFSPEAENSCICSQHSNVRLSLEYMITVRSLSEFMINVDWPFDAKLEVYRKLYTITQYMFSNQRQLRRCL